MARGRKAKANELAEVKPLREVPRGPECCGRAMRKMQNPSASTGKMVTVWVCDGCGTQQREAA